MRSGIRPSRRGLPTRGSKSSRRFPGWSGPPTTSSHRVPFINTPCSSTTTGPSPPVSEYMRPAAVGPSSCIARPPRRLASRQCVVDAVSRGSRYKGLATPSPPRVSSGIRCGGQDTR